MAASITLNPAPGLTVETSLSISLSGSGYDTILASTTVQPTFAKNIAYDEFGNPFLSVVQDGKGNVFFDGGFPKYLNGVWSPAYTSFAAMTNQLKLLYNAMKWCTEGNVMPSNKILVFGDGQVGESYALKNTGPQGFITTFTNVAALAGFSVEAKDLGDYPPSSTMTYEYMSQFACIIFLSSSTLNWESAPARISEATRQNIATYRQQGGGVMVITDHNVFQTLANQVASLFGCSFSGDVNRHPVSIASLIATYGNHPLWANMTGDIWAGGSEGIVTIPVNVPFNPVTDRISLTGPGYKTVFLTISDTFGKVTTSAYSYAMNVPDPVQGTMPTQTSYKFLDLPIEIIRLNSTDTSGTIGVSNALIGSFSKALSGATTKTYTYNYPKPILTSNKETVQVNISINIPVIYHKVYPITLTPVNITSLSHAKRIASMRKNEMAAVGSKARMLRHLREVQSLPLAGVSPADALRTVNNYYSTTYRTPSARTAQIDGWTFTEGSGFTNNWGYDTRPGSGYGTIDSTAPIFSNQVVCYFANYTQVSDGKTYFAVAFTRTDNATQVQGNFSDRRVQLVDANGAVMFDQDTSTATLAAPQALIGLNTFLFTWEIPAPLMKTGGATWRLRVV